MHHLKISFVYFSGDEYHTLGETENEHFGRNWNCHLGLPDLNKAVSYIYVDRSCSSRCNTLRYWLFKFGDLRLRCSYPFFTAYFFEKSHIVLFGPVILVPLFTYRFNLFLLGLVYANPAYFFRKLVCSISDGGDKLKWINK